MRICLIPINDITFSLTIPKSIPKYKFNNHGVQLLRVIHSEISINSCYLIVICKQI